MSSDPSSPAAGELLARSNRLGADRRNTNYGGGNTSAKAMTVDPASGDEVEVMWVKGSVGIWDAWRRPAGRSPGGSAAGAPLGLPGSSTNG